MIRKIKKVIPAVREDIGNLQTYRAMPVSELERVDPFLFLNHHGPQNYPLNNSGLPFGPHPHRGFETVTLILEGDILHRDSGGHESVIERGGVQWMTAGSGLIHSEESSEQFKKNGGPLEILQLWVNLPAGLKMTSPRYVGLQSDAIPEYSGEGVKLRLITGNWQNLKGPFQSSTHLTIMTLSLDAQASWEHDIAASQNIFFYVIRGEVRVNHQNAKARETVEFTNEGETLKVESVSSALILLCFAPPLNEPVVSYGPFVMNTREEIMQAISDYQAGKFS